MASQKQLQSDRFSVMLDVLQASSSRGYADCFAEIGKALAMKKAVVISHVNAKHSAEGYTVSVFLTIGVKAGQ